MGLEEGSTLLVFYVLNHYGQFDTVEVSYILILAATWSDQEWTTAKDPPVKPRWSTGLLRTVPSPLLSFSTDNLYNPWSFLIFYYAICNDPVKSGISSCDRASSGPVPVGLDVTIPRSKGFGCSGYTKRGEDGT